jgi:hypothetical protein
MYLQWCLEGLAGAAAASGEYERAAELDGARDALRAQTGVLLPPIYPAGYARTLATIRAALTPAVLPQQFSTPPAPAAQASHHSTSPHPPPATETPPPRRAGPRFAPGQDPQ